MREGVPLGVHGCIVGSRSTGAGGVPGVDNSNQSVFPARGNRSRSGGLETVRRVDLCCHRRK